MLTEKITSPGKYSMSYKSQSIPGKQTVTIKKHGFGFRVYFEDGSYDGAANYYGRVIFERLCDCGKSGTDRFDNGLPAGTHCNKCWEKLISQCRSRSW